MKLINRKNILSFGSILAVSGVMAVISPVMAQEAPSSPPPAVTAPAPAPVATAPAVPVDMPPQAELKQPGSVDATVSVTPAAPHAESAETIVSTTTVTKEEAVAPEKTDKKKKKASKKDLQKAQRELEEVVAPAANIRPLPKEYLVVKKDHNADDPDARLKAARMALGLERYDAALEMFNDLYSRNPMDTRVLMGRAIALQKMGRAGDAIGAYESVLNNDPKNIEALVNMLGILQGQDQAVAVERLAQLREVYPYNPDITAQLGMAYAHGGDYENAIKYLDMADSLKSGDATITYNRAVVYDRMGQKQKASDLYGRLMRRAADGDLGAGFPVEAMKKRFRTIQ